MTAVVLLCRFESSPTRTTAMTPPSPSGGDGVLPMIVPAAVVAVVVVRAAGWLAARLGQPAVVGQMIGGLVLGPSMLGAFWPDLHRRVFSEDVLSVLDVFAQLGVVIFMFEVGRELPLQSLGHRRATVLTTGLAGLALPLLIGVVLAMGPLTALRPSPSPAMAFALFIGVLLGSTALPVLAHILTERGMRTTDVGAVGLASAGVGDVCVWSLLIVATAQVQSGSPAGAVGVLALVGGFSLVLWVLVRPALAALARRASRAVLAVVLLATAFGAAATMEWLGVGAIFGAFVAGIITPRRSPDIEWLARRVRRPAKQFLLPLFFAVLGLHLEATGSTLDWVVLSWLLAGALGGKALGVYAAGRLTGLAPRAAAILTTMSNCRGLTELVILQAGLRAGLVSGTLFSAILVLTLLTTALTGPMLRLLAEHPGRGT
ncbi:cation:proton antiporter [Saccharothrix sp. AJ9571]|nr:cation:proton antiporter [Saccharothrix sp. AJ9571]